MLRSFEVVYASVLWVLNKDRTVDVIFYTYFVMFTNITVLSITSLCKEMGTNWTKKVKDLLFEELKLTAFSCSPQNSKAIKMIIDNNGLA